MVYYTLAQVFDFAGGDETDDAENAVLFFARITDERALTEYVSEAVNVAKDTAFARAAELNRTRTKGAPEIVVVEINKADRTLNFLEPPQSNGGPRVN